MGKAKADKKTKETQVAKTRGIVVATPAYGGQVTVNYANSLFRSLALFQQYGLKLNIIFICNHSLVTMARNRIVAELFRDPNNQDWDSLVWIDADISWNPQDLLKLCLHDEDVVCATYRKKIASSCHFTMQLIHGKEEPDERGLIEVNSAGAGFFRISKKAMQDVLDSEKDVYVEQPNHPGVKKTIPEIKNIFQTGYVDGEMLSEDFFFCRRLRDLGYKIMLDTKIDLGHDGTFTYRGSVSDYLDYLKSEREKQSEEAETK